MYEHKLLVQAKPPLNSEVLAAFSQPCPITATIEYMQLLPPMQVEHVAQTEVRLPMSVINKNFVVQPLHGMIPAKSHELIDLECQLIARAVTLDAEGIFRKVLKAYFASRRRRQRNCQPIGIYNEFTPKGVCPENPAQT